MEQISVGVLVSIIVPIIGAIGYLAVRIMNISRELAVLTNAQSTGLRDEDRLNSRLNSIEDEIARVDHKSVDDSIKFTEILGQFNVTLTRMDTTLRHFDDTLKEVKTRLSDHDSKLNK